MLTERLDEGAKLSILGIGCWSVTDMVVKLVGKLKIQSMKLAYEMKQKRALMWKEPTFRVQQGEFHTDVFGERFDARRSSHRDNFGVEDLFRCFW